MASTGELGECHRYFQPLPICRYSSTGIGWTTWPHPRGEETVETVDLVDDEPREDVVATPDPAVADLARCAGAPPRHPGRGDSVLREPVSSLTHTYGRTTAPRRANPVQRS
jgi:hypothetical protein